MPSLNFSDLNIVLVVLGIFTVSFGLISVKIKAMWYLGEALPAVIVGIIVGPMVARFVDSGRWGSGARDQEHITLGLTRVVIGIQLVIAGFQLPPKYFFKKWLPILICLLPLMTIMWLFTTGCVLLTMPKLSLLASMVISSCVTCTDPVLSQAVAKGSFADKFVSRPVREIISAEAASNDGFGFPFLMLATYLIRYANNQPLVQAQHEINQGNPPNTDLIAGARIVGRLGGGPNVALRYWLLETWLYFVALSILYGAFLGFVSLWAVRYSTRRKWIDTESYLLFPTALGLFTVGSSGAIGVDELLSCTIAGAVLNWDGEYLSGTLKLQDEVNSSIDLLLNCGGFMYIGAVMPFKDFHQPETTGITIPILLALGVLVLLFRRIPGVLILYKFMPSCVGNWKDALFMGYFGPIGIGAIFYVEHTKHLFPKASQVSPADEEVQNLLETIVPVVYWLVLFSIVVHGLSIPALNALFKFRGVRSIHEKTPVEIRLRSSTQALPKNSKVDSNRKSVIIHNRFSVMLEREGHSQLTEVLERCNEQDRDPRFESSVSSKDGAAETITGRKGNNAELEKISNIV